MTYATVTHIKEEFKSLAVDTGTSIKTAQIERFLEETDMMIDSYLGTVYATPISGIKSLVIVRKIEIDIVATRVARILKINKIKIVAGSVRQELIDGSASKEALAYLKQLQDGKATLLDQSKISSSGGNTSYNTENDIEPVFKKESEQW